MQFDGLVAQTGDLAETDRHHPDMGLITLPCPAFMLLTPTTSSTSSGRKPLRIRGT